MEAKEKKVRFSLIYFLIALALIVLVQRYFIARELVTLSYREKLIDDLKITKDMIEGRLLDGAHDRLLSLRKGKDEREIKHLKEIKFFSVVRMDDPDLVRELTEKGIRFTATQEVTWFKTLLSWVIPLFIFFALWGYLFKRMGTAGEGLMAIGKSKAKVYVEDETKVTFGDVAGVEEAERELQEVIEFLKNPQRYQGLGGKMPKGILLVGPPGTGKTLLARAVAGEAKAPFLSLSGSAFDEMFVGVGAARVRDLFSQSEKLAPCIIFIDELDALGKARGLSPVTGVDEREQTLTQLLSELDGFDTKKGVIIMAATNRPEILDPALLRPGRFDRHVLVDRPDLKGREEIFRVHTKRVKLGPLSFEKGRPLFLEAPWSPSKDYSEDTARKINEEINAILVEAYEKAKTVLTERLEKIRKIASRLIEKEVIEGDELKKLLAD